MFYLQEKEERRRQMMFIKTLETQRRAEERDRRREEMKNERIYIREKKMVKWIKLHECYFEFPCLRNFGEKFSVLQIVMVKKIIYLDIANT